MTRKPPRKPFEQLRINKHNLLEKIIDLSDRAYNMKRTTPKFIGLFDRQVELEYASVKLYDQFNETDYKKISYILEQVRHLLEDTLEMAKTEDFIDYLARKD